MINSYRHPDFLVESKVLQEKREKAIALLGDKWLVATSNFIKKKPTKESVRC